MTGIFKINNNEVFGSDGTFSGTIGNATFPAGHVVKVYSVTFRGTDSNGTDGFVIVGAGDSDELKIVTDTPQSTASKFLITFSIGGFSANGASQTSFQIFKNGSFITNAGSDANTGSRTSETAGHFMTSDANHTGAFAFSFLDSPSSSSALTYDIRFRNQGTTVSTINYPYGNLNDSGTYASYSASTLIIQEVA